MGAVEFLYDLDRVTDELLRDKPRGHLGASQVGARCARQVWLQFRWAGEEKVGGRMRRLWDRGHEEEHRVVRWLRAMDIEVRDYAERLMYHAGSDSYVCVDWDAKPSHHGGEEFDHLWAECDDVSEDPTHINRATARGEGPKQWGFTEDFGTIPPGEAPQPAGGKGHFAGSGDGKLSPAVAKWWPEVEGHGWGLFENKTHKASSFQQIKTKGLVQGKPEHYTQMQIYMNQLGLKWGLYIAVNKDTDEIYAEVIWHREEVSQPYIDRGRTIVEAQTAPAKLTDDPSWFECRFCPFREQCQYDAPLEMQNCRSCSYSSAATGGRWYCGLHGRVIPDDFVAKGCSNWEPCL
jgi:hypothetical protein